MRARMLAKRERKREREGRVGTRESMLACTLRERGGARDRARMRAGRRLGKSEQAPMNTRKGRGEACTHTDSAEEMKEEHARMRAEEGGGGAGWGGRVSMHTCSE